MNYFQRGFGGMQLLIVGAVIGITAMVAMPKYNAFVDKAKLTEAFNFAGESKKKLSEYYMMSSRLPRTSAEAQGMVTEGLSPPKFVDNMVIYPNHMEHDVVVKVYLRPNVIENKTGEAQFIYVAGDQSGKQLLWSCGSSGIDAELLPEGCNG